VWIYGQLLQRCVAIEDVCGSPIERGKLGLSARLTILEEHLNQHGTSARRRPVSRAAEQPLPPTRESQRRRFGAYSFILGRNILLPSSLVVWSRRSAQRAAAGVEAAMADAVHPAGGRAQLPLVVARPDSRLRLYVHDAFRYHLRRWACVG
jgi:hypothetical protein